MCHVYTTNYGLCQGTIRSSRNCIKYNQQSTTCYNEVYVQEHVFRENLEKKKKNSFTKKYVLNHVLFLYLRYFSVFTVFFKCQSYFSNKTSYIVLSNKPLVECFKSYAILGLASK